MFIEAGYHVVVFVKNSCSKIFHTSYFCRPRNRILAALLNANKCDNTVDEKRKRIKACLHGYSKLTTAIRKELEDIGFSLSDDGKHVKAVFGEDQRYMGTLSKTGSDHRAGDNIAHDLIRLIF